MGLKLCLVQWDESAAMARAARLAGQGWQVFSGQKDEEDAYQTIRTIKPDLVLFDLSNKPTNSLQVAETLRKCKSLATLPFVFVDGDARSLHNARERILNAEFTTSKDLLTAIRKLSSKPCLA